MSLLPDLIYTVKGQARVVQRADNAVHRINHYPVDSVLCFVIIYQLDSDLSGGERYLPMNNRTLNVGGIDPRLINLRT